MMQSQISSRPRYSELVAEDTAGAHLLIVEGDTLAAGQMAALAAAFAPVAERLQTWLVSAPATALAPGKVRKLHKDQVLAGFAGATADAFTLFERFEAKLEKHQGQLVRAAIELTKDWRTDRVLRRLEAMLAVADRSASLIITGNGDVLEPEHGIVAIGSGGAYAQAAAKGLLDHTDLSAEDIVRKSLAIAGELCIYTNMHHTVEVL